MKEEKKKKFRHELKYYINKMQFEEIKKRISFMLDTDKNTKEDGSYFIRSLYFDDYRDTSYYQVVDGISKREKYRIRYYNYDLSYICLEKKFKINNMTNKTSCRITKKQVEDLINGKLNISKDNDKLLNEFILKTKFYGYKPAVVVSYNRIPYVYRAGNVRLTLDYNISIDYNTDGFLKKQNVQIPIIEDNMMVLEVKYDEFIPNYITWLFNINTLERTSYSKYLIGRKMGKSIK